MMNIDLTEECFDLVLTPDIGIQYQMSNWVRKGQGRQLAQEMANHCNCELGDYFIAEDDSVVKQHSLEDVNYLTFHPGSGAGQWEGRNYRSWNEVLLNVKKLFPTLKIVQLGFQDEPLSPQTDVDLRSKTSYQQLASVLKNADVHLGIDSFSAHVAAGFNVPTVLLFGCSYAKITGPKYKDMTTARFIYIESEGNTGCGKTGKKCYKNRCNASPEGDAPMNEISAEDVFKSVAKILLETK